MFWKSRKKSLTISAELHEKVARNSVPIYLAGSEVTCVRPAARPVRRKEKTNKRQKQFYCYGA